MHMNAYIKLLRMLILVHQMHLRMVTVKDLLNEMDDNVLTFFLFFLPMPTHPLERGWVGHCISNILTQLSPHPLG